MEIRFAINQDTLQVITLFEKNLSYENDAIHSEEFFCHAGVKAAIRRQQILVAVEGNIIVAAIRFYRQKNKIEYLYLMCNY